MTDAAVKAILASLTALANKLGLAAGQIFQFYLRQQRVEAYQDMFTIGVCLVVMTVAVVAPIVCWRLTQREFATHRPSDGAMALRVLPCIFGPIAVIISFGIACACVNSLMTELLNPGYGAMQEILRAIH